MVLVGGCMALAGWSDGRLGRLRVLCTYPKGEPMKMTSIVKIGATLLVVMYCTSPVVNATEAGSADSDDATDVLPIGNGPIRPLADSDTGKSSGNDSGADSGPAVDEKTCTAVGGDWSAKLQKCVCTGHRVLRTMRDRQSCECPQHSTWNRKLSRCECKKNYKASLADGPSKCVKAK